MGTAPVSGGLEGDLTPDEMSEAAVELMLEAAGLHLSREDRVALTRAYGRLKPGIEALHELPEARYEVPALVFPAAPQLAPWPER